MEEKKYPGKVHLSFRMDKELSDKLDYVAEKQKRSKAKAVQWLIEQEYERLKKQ